MGEFDDGDHELKTVQTLADLVGDLLEAEKQVNLTHARHKGAMERWMEAEGKVTETKTEAEKAQDIFNEAANAVARRTGLAS